MNEKQTTTTEVRGNKMDYTNEELEARLKQLEEYEYLMFRVAVGLVGREAIERMNKLSIEYGVDDPESWWNDTASIEAELLRRGASK